jgi:hypothetical protein
MKRRLILLLALVLASLLSAAGAYAQEDDDEALSCEHPRVVYLVEKTGATCEEILALHSSGVGFGQILKAAVIAEGLPGFEGDWQDLLAAHQEEVGWGEIARAYGLASRYEELGLTGEELLDLKQEDGLGWGEIAHAQALAAADLDLLFEDALAKITGGMGWGEIRDELGLPPGPPPWSHGGGKDKDKEPGPPEWANNDKNKE